jgi:hypothetical protein
MTTQPLTKTRLIQLGVAIALALPLVWIVRGFLGGEFFEAQTRRDRAEALGQLIKSSGGSGITLDRYDQVQSGMSIAKVETIVGEGIETNRSEAGGSLTVSYKWQNADGSTMNAMFQGNKLVTKAQTSLK